MEQLIVPTITTITNTGALATETIVGQAYDVEWTVDTDPSGLGTPTGQVTVTDGTGVCTPTTLPATSCTIMSSIEGPKSITATYEGDADFAPSISAPESHTVLTDVLSVGAVTPASHRGTANQVLQVNGTGFVPGSTVTFSGLGITVNSTTFVDPTSVGVSVSIGGVAALGARNVARDPARRSLRPLGRLRGLLHGEPVADHRDADTGIASGRDQRVDHGDRERRSGPGADTSFSGSGISVNGVQFNSATSLTLDLTIDAGATVGARSLTVTNPDDGVVTKNNTFTVNALPTITSIVPSARAEDTVNNSIAINGTGFQAGIGLGSFAISGAGVNVGSVTPDSATKVTVVLSISPGFPLGPRDVTITNPDGGSATCDDCFTVNAKPTVGFVDPPSRRAACRTRASR